ncbi:MAG: hypothetical protein QM785_14645 [Pyrinomonadaceae bacterium]
MVIPLVDYDKILQRHAKRPSLGDEPPELTAEDEEILDRAWAELREEHQTASHRDDRS